MYCGGSELKYPGIIAKNMFYRVGNMPYTKPNLNLPDSVDKWKNYNKTVFVDATVLFELPYMQIWSRTVVTQNLNRSSSTLQVPSYSVSYRTNLPSIETHKLDMCDTNVQKHQFSNPPAYEYCFEAITWYYSSNCAKITLFKSKLCKFVLKGIKGVRVLLPLVFIYFGNCNDIYQGFKVFQGFFICHIINYTGYNQKWNVIESGPLSGQCKRIKKELYKSNTTQEHIYGKKEK